MATPAEQMGLVVGQEYLYQSNGQEYSQLDGKMLRFRRDDSTQNPAFDVPTSFDSDGWTFLQLKYISATAKQEGNTSFSVTVEHGRTVITIGKKITAEEAAKILAAAGVK